MKAVKISVTHGRIWVVETSSGVRTQSSTMEGALEQLLPPSPGVPDVGYGFGALAQVFGSIPDSGGDGNIGRGVKSG